jgi:hypothetical protein
MFSLSTFIDGSTLAALAESVRTAFNTITTQAQAAWNREHATDGTHGHVTATTVTTDGLARAGRLAVSFPFAPPTTTHPSRMTMALPFTGSPYRNLFVPSTVGFLRLTTDDVFNTIVKGISGTGREPGDLLCVANASQVSSQDISLSLWDSTDDGAQFDGNRDAPGSVLVLISPGRWVWLIYDVDEVGVRAWRVHA